MRRWRGGASVATRGLIAGAAFAYVMCAYLLSPIPRLSRITLLALLLLGGILAVTAARSHLRLPNRPALAVAAGFIGIALTSVLHATDPLLALEAAVGCVSAIIGGLAVATASLTIGSLRPVAAAAGAAAIVQISLVVLGVDTGGLTEVGRSAGLAGNPNVLAIQLAVAATLVAIAWPRAPARLLACAFVAAGLGVTGSRKMLIVVACMLLWGALALLCRERRRWLAVPAVGVALVLGAAGVAFGDGDLGARMTAELLGIPAVERGFIMLEGGDASSSERYQMIVSAVALWADAPIAGSGLDHFRVASGFGTYSHNNYAELLVGVGLTGVIVYYAFFALIVVGAVRAGGWRRPVPRAVLVAVALLVLCDVALVSYVEKVPWILAGAALVLIRVGDSRMPQAMMSRAVLAAHARAAGRLEC